MPDKKYSIAVIGGTGALGFGLALRWAKSGHEIVKLLPPTIFKTKIFL